MFPSRTVSPDQAISQLLLDGLRGCDGFLYLDTPISHGSFWVGFERNMAARLGKPRYAFRPRRLLSSFRRDDKQPADPIISVLFNLCIAEDVAKIGEIRELAWERYRFEIRGDQWRRLDNDARQMFDSIDGIERKLAAGGVAMVFLSNASICDGHQDYVDPFSFRRASKDGETPTGYTGDRFARLDPNRTLVIWLEAPDVRRIETALDRLRGDTWAPYVKLVRVSLRDQHKLVVTRSDGRFDLNQLDTMLARCFWAALLVDPNLAASFRVSLTRPTR